MLKQVDYTDFSYLWPPRPENKVPKAVLADYEKNGWIAQRKKNGTCTVVFCRGDTIIFKTRHNDDHRMWIPNKEHIDFFRGLSDHWNVFVGELLHSKTPHIKDHLVLFDQIVANGKHLVGSKLMERQELLKQRWPTGESLKDTVKITKYFSRIKNFKAGFRTLFNDMAPEDEGLVLKDPNAPLQPCWRQTANNEWQVKSRIPTKNLSF
jgi:hypothetical protein